MRNWTWKTLNDVLESEYSGMNKEQRWHYLKDLTMIARRHPENATVIYWGACDFRGADQDSVREWSNAKD